MDEPTNQTPTTDQPGAPVGGWTPPPAGGPTTPEPAQTPGWTPPAPPPAPEPEAPAGGPAPVEPTPTPGWTPTPPAPGAPTTDDSTQTPAGGDGTTGTGPAGTV